MNLTSGHPFWLVKNGLSRTWPTLTESRETDVLVIGAGVTGALIAQSLVKAGIKTTVIDRSEVGWGSSSASTALIQYEIDTPLRELADIHGISAAVEAYRACLQAVVKLEKICEEFGVRDFTACKSFYFASDEKDQADLLEEFKLREKYDFPVHLWNRKDIENFYSFTAPIGIMSDVAAQVDVYQLTQALLHGQEVYDRTGMKEINRVSGGYEVITTQGHAIRCQHVIMATGYESQNYLPKKVAKITSTFAFVSEPLESFQGWYDKTLLWETARPYLYARTTADNRALFGGEDIPFRNAAARDAWRERKIKVLLERARTMFPQLDLTASFAWAGTFAETPDGLPFIGKHPALPDLNFAMCYGGNGIVYSILAAEILRDSILGEKHPLAELFSFNREIKK